MSYLSEEADPARFPVPKDDPMKILIGPENVADALKDTSVVVASYDIGDGMRGVIGVVGPTRMDYAKITARLSYLAEGLSRLFGQGELPQEMCIRDRAKFDQLTANLVEATSGPVKQAMSDAGLSSSDI